MIRRVVCLARHILRGVGVINRCVDRIVEARWATLAIATLLVLVTTQGARGQDGGEVQVFFISGNSDSPAFDSYSGVGISTTFAMPGDVFRIRWVFDTESTSLMREGWVCAKAAAIGRGCALETGILDETRRDNVSITVQAVLPLSDWVRLSVATGPLYSSLRWESTTKEQRSGEAPVYNCEDLPDRGPPPGGDPSGVSPQRCTLPAERVPNIKHQKRPRIGVVLGGEVEIRPMTTLPFVISAGWDRKAVNMTGCAPIDARRYAPFCGWAHSDELRFGLGVVF